MAIGEAANGIPADLLAGLPLTVSNDISQVFGVPSAGDPGLYG